MDSRNASSKGHVMALPGSIHMKKRLLQLTTPASAATMLCAAMILPPEVNSADHPGPTPITSALHQGMTMSDVQSTLGCRGNIWKVQRNQKHATSDPLDWNIEWQISSIYVSNTDQPDQVVSFEAWGMEGSTDRPPDSAFRLMAWREVG